MEQYTVRRFEKIEQLREVWEEIYRQNPSLQPCQSYVFCETFVNDFRFSRQRVFLRPVFYALLREEEVRMILPLWRKNASNYYLIPDFLITPYRDFIWRADCTAGEFGIAIAMVKQELGGAALHLRRINERSALCGWLMQNCQPQNPKPCVRIEFTNGYAEWLGGLAGSTRQNLRTAQNRLQRDGHSVQLCLQSGYAPSQSEWEEIIRVHRKRYLMRDGERIGPITNWIRRHHEPIEKMLRFSPDNFLARLYIDGKLAAFFNGLLSADRKTISVFRLSIEDDFGFYSPGMLLVARSIEQLSRQGETQVLDLCYGGQPYKYRLGGVETLDYDFLC